MTTYYWRGGTGALNTNGITGTNACLVTSTSAARITATRSGTVLTVTAVTAGTLAVNQKVVSAAGTSLGVITSLGTGTGGTGTYNMDTSGTVASTTMTAFDFTSPQTALGGGDDIIVDQYSGNGNGNFTLTVTNATTSTLADFLLNGGWGGTMTLAGSGALSLSGSLKLPSANFTRSYTGAVTFTPAAGATKTIDPGAYSFASAFTLNAASGTGTLRLLGNVTTTGAVTLTQGLLDLNSYVLQAASASGSNANTRGFVLPGSITLTASSGTKWNFATATNLSFSGGALSVTFSTTGGTVSHGATAGGSSTNKIGVSCSSGSTTTTYTGHFGDFSHTVGTLTFTSPFFYGSVDTGAAAFSSGSSTITVNNGGANVSLGGLSTPFAQPASITGATIVMVRQDTGGAGTAGLTLTSCTAAVGAVIYAALVSTAAETVTGLTIKGGTYSAACSIEWDATCFVDYTVAPPDLTGVVFKPMIRATSRTTLWAELDTTVTAQTVHRVKQIEVSSVGGGFQLRGTIQIDECRKRGSSTAIGVAFRLDLAGANARAYKYEFTSATEFVNWGGTGASQSSFIGYNAATPTQTTITCASGTVFLQSTSIRTIAAAGGATFIAAAPYCSNVAGNSGWYFGTTASASQAEAATPSDASDAGIAYAASSSDSYTLTDTSDGGTVVADTASASESGAAQESASSQALLVSSESEAVAGVDSSSAIISLSAEAGEAGAAADASSSTVQAAADSAESLAPVETPAALLSLSASAAEQGAAAESASALASLLAGASDLYTAAEALSGALSLLAASVEQAPLADAPDASAQLLSDVSEAGAAAEESNAGTAYVADALESGSAADVQSADLVLSSAAAEVATSVDTSDATASLVASAGEQSPASELADAISSLIASQADSGLLIETPAASLSLMASADDIAGIVDATSAKASAFAAAVEAGAAADLASAIALLAGVVGDGYVAVDESSAVASLLGAVSEFVDAVETIDGIVTEIPRPVDGQTFRFAAGAHEFLVKSSEAGQSEFVIKNAQGVLLVKRTSDTGQPEYLVKGKGRAFIIKPKKE